MLQDHHDRAGEPQGANRCVPLGTTILVYSTTFLAECGLVAYVEEFLAICMVLRERLGKSTIILPLPPIILGGI
jgi:hypothetical protein